MGPKLKEIFPNIQFVITTHSPIVVSSVKKHTLRKLSNGRIEFGEYPSFGRNPKEILEDYFGFSDYPEEIKDSMKEMEENPDNRNS